MSAPPAAGGTRAHDDGSVQGHLSRIHQIWGWLGLLLFACFGLTLELLNGLKVGMYLDPEMHIRREMWRLAHAHGTLLSVVQLVFASALVQGRLTTPSRAELASFFFRGALVLLPGGFLLGGARPSESDPWIGVWLVPVGAAFLLFALALTAWEVCRRIG
jgi:hypothetical protein